ncbi:uncharacterized protein [Drosophila takahashii]|uniref:uncharacterized protein n=1 Tax=Drosophila takahashii TaxID=29030 RepID=UPI001CF8D77B|nr:uncharacterized protein LOC108065770 [Drosophila takahashii]
MCANLFWLGLIACVAFARSIELNEAKRFFSVGGRVDGDQLLVKDVLHSRPAGLGELPKVTFTYEIQEPINCIDILSEENISAEVKFSLVNRLVVGMVQLAGSNQNVDEATESPASEFDVTIMVFGLNETAGNFDPSHVINRDQQYEGSMEPYEDFLSEPDTQYVEVYDNNRRDALEVIDEMEDISEEDVETFTEGPSVADHFDTPDKYIEIGNRQAGDELLHECYQTSENDSEKPANHSVVFYYIDSNCITYVKFVILDYYTNKNISGVEYQSPVAEYSHYSTGTLKAVVTNFETKTLYVQMYIYGYRGREAPASYVPFLPPPAWQRTVQQQLRPGAPHLTPLQTLQLLLMTGQRSTPPPGIFNESFEPEQQRSIKPEEMMLERIGDDSGNSTYDDNNDDEKNSALRQLNQGMSAWLGLLFLLILQNN